MDDRGSRAAGGWTARRAQLQEVVAPVSHWLIDAIAPQPGHRVLELAAGLGDTGFLAAELIQPGGELITSDFAEPMLEAAEERAAELGLTNVTFKAIDAEWIDEPTASLDAVLCRFGYMLMLDPGAALQETRRGRPGRVRGVGQAGGEPVGRAARARARRARRDGSATAR